VAEMGMSVDISTKKKRWQKTTSLKNKGNLSRNAKEGVRRWIADE
jgi:hypothetical protein